MSAIDEQAVRRLRLLVYILALALIATLVMAAVLWRDRPDEKSTNAKVFDAVATAEAADTAARKAAVAITTYNWRTVEQDYVDVTDIGTDDFVSYWDGIAPQAVKVIKAVRAAAVGVVIDSAARVKDADHAHVLIFLDQRIRDRSSKTDKVDQPRVSLEMVREDGLWLVDRLNINNTLRDSAS